MLVEPELAAADDGTPLLAWRWRAPKMVVSSASVGGGIGLRSWAVNAEVDKHYARTDLDAHIRELSESVGLTGDGVGMLTAARVADRVVVADDGLLVTATLGISVPTWAAAPDDCDEIDEGVPAVGTINVVVDLDIALAAGAGVNVVMTATEAKTQALLDKGVAGTGTASDAVCVVSLPDGETERFGGPRSTWGARIARATHAAVAEGVERWRA